MGTYAVLPVKTFTRAKQRLAGRVGPVERPALARAMVGDVLDALAAAGGLAGVIVVTAEPQARAAAQEHGATVVHDDREAGQSAAATLGVRAALGLGATRALLVPGDCPTLDPAEIAALLDSPAAVTIVRDRHGTGTNALLLAPPDAIEPSFGPGSFARHAAAAGPDHRVARLPSLELDVDTPDDLEALRAALGRRAHGAPRTRALLDSALAA